MTKSTTATRRIGCRYIEDKNARQGTFSKRKKGLLKKIHELSVLTNTDILIVLCTNNNFIVSMTENMKSSLQTDEGKKIVAQMTTSD